MANRRPPQRPGAPAYHVLMNVTLSVDARVVAEARRIAAARGTTLNQMIRDYLHDLTRHDDVEPPGVGAPAVRPARRMPVGYPRA